LSDSLEKIGDLPKIESLSGSVKDYLKNKVLLNLHLNLFLVFHSIYIKLPQSLFCSISSLDLFEFDLVHFPLHIYIKKISLTGFPKWIKSSLATILTSKRSVRWLSRSSEAMRLNGGKSTSIRGRREGKVKSQHGLS